MKPGVKVCEILADSSYLPLPMRAACMAQGLMMEQMVSQMRGIVQMLLNGQLPLPPE